MTSELVKDGNVVRVDLHSHSCRSHDCGTTFKKLIATCQRRGVDVLAVTDHNRIEGALEMAEQAPFQVIVGEEVMTTEGEIIGLFLRDFIPPRLSPEETVEEIRRQGGLVYVPHPFDRVRRGVITRGALDRIVDRVDAIEVLNARIHIADDNAAAENYAREHRLLRAAGSDAHTAFEIGRAGVEMPRFTDAASFKTSLALGRIVGRSSPPIVHVASTFAKYRKRYLPGWSRI